MIINDINYLETSNEEVFGGKGIDINSKFKLDKDVKANVDVKEKFDKAVKLDLKDLKGYGAEVLGTADASGDNTFTSIIFGVQTDPGKSESFVNASAFTY
ncbi:MAG: hypothetical protein KME60_02480 [Cyanomargarita calcarea GSE-NOS-MK-12-04C]|jgi:hypothetical protein|uniref:Uncharacterized protein n=1 Tax=Cyanomargarita calcarea GSE-NOS-MK-12-04C TaxID=2839659 RepID=A0A951QJU2_9CYAN|nr:hypothetical protein [Cyanomargarita calcarea GSE-NOS-MK-12-04C]